LKVLDSFSLAKLTVGFTGGGEVDATRAVSPSTNPLILLLADRQILVNNDSLHRERVRMH